MKKQKQKNPAASKPKIENMELRKSCIFKDKDNSRQ